MAENNGKIVYYGEVLMDLTQDDVDEAEVKKGVRFHGPDGEQKVGTCTFDVDSSGATVKESEVLAGKTFGAKGQMKSGTMTNNGAVNGVINTKDEQYTVPPGYHDGSGRVSIAEDEKAKLVPQNIRQGVEVLGVVGNMQPTEGVKAQSKSVKPTKEGAVVTPDPEYNYLSQVTVQPIPFSKTPNEAGGMTVTIGE